MRIDRVYRSITSNMKEYIFRSDAVKEKYHYGIRVNIFKGVEYMEDHLYIDDVWLSNRVNSLIENKIFQDPKERLNYISSINDKYLDVKYPEINESNYYIVLLINNLWCNL